MEVLQHSHPLKLTDLNPKYPHDEEVYEDDAELIAKQDFRHSCARCAEEINFIHRYYFKCDQCNYSLHKLCAKFPITLKHASHSAHTLILYQTPRPPPSWSWSCEICKSDHEYHSTILNQHYWCSQCDIYICLECGMNEALYHMIYHPSHKHPLVPISRTIGEAYCDACGQKHEGVFYQCTTCFRSLINIDCVFQPKRLLIQDATDKLFFHSHPLTLTYSFPEEDQKTKFYPTCRVCDYRFHEERLWVYKCEKCRYYVHISCAIPIDRYSWDDDLSITGMGNYVQAAVELPEQSDHLHLHLPFPDQTSNLVKHLFSKEGRSNTFKANKMNHKKTIHQHPLTLVDESCIDIERSASSSTKISCSHNPITKVELLCDGCLRPIITNTPFYKCTFNDHECNFVIHEWCTRLPDELKDRKSHPDHTLVLQTQVHQDSFKLFGCAICNLPCNGFAYTCATPQCQYTIDVNCAFIPEHIIHESHPNHPLSRIEDRWSQDYCRLCRVYFKQKESSFSCRLCDFSIHPNCALLLPRTISHKYDKHLMNLSYAPVENYRGEYFCEICEEEFDPKCAFYHCHECDQSIHSVYALSILQCERRNYPQNMCGVDQFANIKFGAMRITEHHPHPLTLLLGIESDGVCSDCGLDLFSNFILKCLKCTFVVHCRC